MKKTVGTFDMGRFILVADRGMYSGTNIQAILKAYGIEIQAKIYTKGEIREIKSTVNQF